MTTINYKRVKCPKCGKSYFRVKEDTDFNISFLVFTKKPEPIYKDGELQNPTETEPIKERCECLECGCNFRVETYDVFGEYKFIDEDEERKENERMFAESFKVLKKETEKKEPELVLNDSCQIQCNSIEFDKAPFTIDSYQETAKEALDEVKAWQNEFRKELDDIKERLAKLEKKK